MLSNLFAQLFLFTAKSVILVALLLVLLVGIIGIVSRGKGKMRGQLTIKNINNHYQETKRNLLEEILPKEQFKKFIKDEKKALKIEQKSIEKTPSKNIFLLNFDGDIKASAVAALREEVTAILGIATPQDEIIVRLESAGGMVHAYGLAASQLARIRQQQIPLTITVDKVAASGGYMMACIANKILAAPFAIIGSIGVVIQMPNFHRLLKEKNIDFEQLTAGQFKRTLSLFGHNTQEGREKMHQEIEEVHLLFKNLIKEYRHDLDIEKVATGEHWLGAQALDLKLVDELKTSDDYLLEQSKHAKLYEVTYHMKKSLREKLSGSVSSLLFGPSYP